MWANKTLGVSCTVENTAYIAYEANGEFIDIVSRGDCQLGLYCDAATTLCMAEKNLGEACTADKECASWNCLTSGVCGVSESVPHHFAIWVYIIVGLGIFGGMFGTLFFLFFTHRKQRDEEREKRLQYWREQNAFHQNLLQMRETARPAITGFSQRGLYKQKAAAVRRTMTSISSIDTVVPRSTTPSGSGPQILSGSPKGLKGKQRESDVAYDDEQLVVDSPPADNLAYPPTNDDAEDTRRIEQNLKRWDAAERQRRKAARESTPASPSLVSDVSRRASLLWSGKRARHRNDSSLGNHVALQSQENINTVPLDDINATPTPSPSPSPCPSPQPRQSTNPDDPFANPPEALSPFADSHQLTHSSAMDSDHDGFLSPNLSSRTPPGPPMPLGLPPPRTPPPPVDAPPRPTSPPLSSRIKLHEPPPKETRWWHEWLCGCGEGPDRGGEYQAGRTNPFE
ncbi:hypothetical protein H0H81_002349 [Sphagnurus paluster]|uniref:Uncharacterized protein n=1 Tax=Sphagnurus paluster TaxID=117069 RepID=A0A9P7FTR6_9AGAR|nr:hypothetical protein H0H81_002349 [Sphagnurus paluster]